MVPPFAPEKGKTTLPFIFPKTPVTFVPFTDGNNKRMTMSSQSALLPPPKELKSGAEDTLFQGGRELWLAKRLTDPEIYLPLQANKESPAPPGVRYKTKAAVHRYLASEFNQQKEHAGFMVDEGKIKNKIAKMAQNFKLAHRFRHALGFGRTDEMTWRDAVKERYAYYFILEPVWASVWSDGIALCTDSPTILDDNVLTDVNPDGSRSTGSIQPQSDGSGEDERSDADSGSNPRPGYDQGWADAIPATKDDTAGDTVEEELDESIERGGYCTTMRERDGNTADGFQERDGNAADGLQERDGNAADGLQERDGNAADGFQERDGNAADGLQERDGSAADRSDSEGRVGRN
ncbi:MAG: hypothetical protein JOS17DRAFT_808603 [Linnemannia elongata]|nr:MAG: hypothetical protein JOS17DRAFT_808603 [Linnemannia elongata]